MNKDTKRATNSTIQEQKHPTRHEPAQYKNNEQAPHKDRNTIQEHEPSQYKNNEQAPEPWNTMPDKIITNLSFNYTL